MKKKITKKVVKAPVSKKVIKKPLVKKSNKIQIKQPITKKVVKKSVSQKVGKNNTKIIKDEIISKEDANIIEDSFNLIKNLNTQVETVHQVKSKLQEDMKKLDYRLSKHEEKNNNLFQNKFILTIKEELIKEFTPILNKMDYKSLKVDMFKEIEKILEIEIQKSRSEFDLKTRRTSQDFSKRVSELEIRIIESLKSNENIKNEMKKFEKKQISLIMEEFEDKIKTSINNIILKEGVNLTSIQSKLGKLEKDFEANKQLIGKYENELYNREKDESSKVEERVKSTLKQTEELLNKLKIEKNASEKQIKENIEILKKSLDKNYDEINVKANKKLDTAINEFNVEKSTLEKDLELFKVEVSSLIKNYITQLDTELKDVKINGANLKTQNINTSKELEKKLTEFKVEIKKTLKNYEDERGKERKIISQRADELLKEHGDNLKKITEENKIIKKALEVELHMDITDHLNISKEEISKHIISLNNSLTQILTESKESQRNLAEDIESKFVLSKEQYETEFNNHLNTFEIELKNKENEFLDKLKVIEDDKNLMLKELNIFKVEISQLTKDYVKKLDEELQAIKAQEINFDDRKKEFLGYMETLTSVKKVEIEDYSKSLKNSISEILNKQSETFEIHENTFRDIFNEKIQYLSENTKKRLDNLDKKFLDKNIKIVDEKISESTKIFKLIEEELQSKSNELDKRIESMEKKEGDFYVQLNAQLHSLNEKVEERLISYEKQFNKRFLEYDSSFTNFKGTIVDEVEDLIKEVNVIMNTKLENLDKNIAKMNFINTEATTRLNEFKQIQSVIENEVRDTRDEINDLRVKYELEVSGGQNLNNHVKIMSEYETQLIALIKTLKDKRVSDSSIKLALVNKGHPRFYVSMILENYEEITNY